MQLHRANTNAACADFTIGAENMKVSKHPTHNNLHGSLGYRRKLADTPAKQSNRRKARLSFRYTYINKTVLRMNAKMHGRLRGEEFTILNLHTPLSRWHGLRY